MIAKKGARAPRAPSKSASDLRKVKRVSNC